MSEKGTVRRQIVRDVTPYSRPIPTPPLTAYLGYCELHPSRLRKGSCSGLCAGATLFKGAMFRV